MQTLQGIRTRSFLLAFFQHPSSRQSVNSAPVSICSPTLYAIFHFHHFLNGCSNSAIRYPSFGITKLQPNDSIFWRLRFCTSLSRSSINTSPPIALSW